jgi:hypothetical protein
VQRLHKRRHRETVRLKESTATKTRQNTPNSVEWESNAYTGKRHSIDVPAYSKKKQEGDV